MEVGGRFAFALFLAFDLSCRARSRATGLQWDRINSEAVRIKGALKKARHHLCIV
jgi:hypothetical protein